MRRHESINLSHLLQYVLLFFVLIIGIFIYLNAPPIIRPFIAVTLAAIYPTWGIWHHWEHHQHFSWSVVIEYLLISLLILVVLISIL